MRWEKEATFLEEQYADRGLRFTSPFEGFSPMQAYGHLDGKRFYFCLDKYGQAFLQVGIYDVSTEIQKIKRYKIGLETVMGFGGGLPVPELPKESDTQLKPSVILMRSYIERTTQSNLTTLFSDLLTRLEPAQNRLN